MKNDFNAQTDLPLNECDADHATKWYGAAPARGCEATGGGDTYGKRGERI